VSSDIVCGVLFFFVFGIDKKSFIEKEDIRRHHERTDDDANIRDIENREIDERKFKKVNDVSKEKAVDHIADSAADDQRHRRAEKRVEFTEAVENDGQNDDGDRGRREKYPSMLTEHTPSRAAVLDMGKGKESVNECNRIVKRKCLYDDVFGYLVNEYG
jgi:hypothetical protein